MSDNTAGLFSPEAFRHAITRSGLKGERLAEVLELRRNHIYRLRSGKASPSVEVLSRIAAALGGTPADYLILPPRGRWQLQHFRLAAGLTQSAVAERVGVDQTSIYKWEARKSRPPEAAVKTLADLYGARAGEVREAIDRGHAELAEYVLELADFVRALAQIGIQAANHDTNRLADIRSSVIETLSILDNTLEHLDDEVADRAEQTVAALAKILRAAPSSEG